MFSWSTEKACRFDTDCQDFEICLESYKRKGGIAVGMIEWASEKKICTAVSPDTGSLSSVSSTLPTSTSISSDTANIDPHFILSKPTEVLNAPAWIKGKESPSQNTAQGNKQTSITDTLTTESLDTKKDTKKDSKVEQSVKKTKKSLVSADGQSLERQKQQCIHDCAKQICDSTTCSMCTSMGALQNSKTKKLEALHSTKRVANNLYQRPEGLCYNHLQKQRNCSTHDDCEIWQMCVEEYERPDVFHVDWASQRTFCVAISPSIAFPLSNSNSLSALGSAPGRKDSSLVSSGGSMDAFDRDVYQEHAHHFSAYKHKKHLCSNDCSNFMCGDKICTSCTAYSLHGDGDTPSNSLYYDRPDGTCYNEAFRAQHCEEDGDCEPWQMCMFRYSKENKRINWKSEKSFCVDTTNRKDYIDSGGKDSSFGQMIRSEDKLHNLHKKKVVSAADLGFNPPKSQREGNGKFDDGPNSLATSKKYKGTSRPERYAFQCPEEYVKSYGCAGGTNKDYPRAWSWSYPYHRIYDDMLEVRGNRKVPDNKYYLVILAIFKNEKGAMKEWLEHHIGHGVQHFYLIDDGSTDNPEEILKAYIDEGIVTMYDPTPRNVPYRQAGMYKKVFSDIYAKNESYWVAIIDLDEFLYSPKEKDIKKILEQHEDLSVVGVNWLIFGSNGHESQPKSIIQSFTRRAQENPNKYIKLIEQYKVLKWSERTNGDWQKSIVNTKFKVEQVDVHESDVEGLIDNLSVKRYPHDPPLIINHYIVQSKEYFTKVKATRGDVNNWVPENGRDEKFFKMCDINDEEDTRLRDQNKKYFIATNL